MNLRNFVLSIFVISLLYGTAFAEGSKFDRFANDAEVTAQARRDVGLTPANIPYIKAAEANATVKDTLTIKDGNSTQIIKAVYEPGLGGRLTLGLDETARTMVICDAGDVDTDFGLSTASNPTLYLYNANGTLYARFDYTGMLGSYYLYFQAHKNILFRIKADLDGGTSKVNAFILDSDANIELTDTNAEQSWLYIEPKINQSATAAYNGLKIKVTETATGNATTGDGGGTNNLILAGTSTDPDKFKVENDGDLTMSVGKFSAAAMTFTFTTEADITDPLTGSVVLLDGDNDGENDTIDLQDGTTTGQILYLIAAVDIDVNDTCTINYGDTTCTNCPATVFDKVGENAHLIWTGSTWVVISLQSAL